MFGENAVILDISLSAATDDGWDGDPTDPGTIVWSGSAPCTLRRQEVLVGAPGIPQEHLGRSMARAGLATLTYLDQLIVRTAAGIPTAIVPGGRLTGYTVLVEDRRDPANVTQQRYTVHSVQLRAGATPGQSILFTLGDGA